jgi:hypothetical protein
MRNLHNLSLPSVEEREEELRRFFEGNMPRVKAATEEAAEARSINILTEMKLEQHIHIQRTALAMNVGAVLLEVETGMLTN